MLTLGGLVSALMALDPSAMREELHAFHAPSECYGDVYRNIGRRALQLISEAGYVDLDHLERALVARTSEWWVHFSPISEVLSLAYDVENHQVNGRRRWG